MHIAPVYLVAERLRDLTRLLLVVPHVKRLIRTTCGHHRSFGSGRHACVYVRVYLCMCVVYMYDCARVYFVCVFIYLCMRGWVWVCVCKKV